MNYSKPLILNSDYPHTPFQVGLQIDFFQNLEKEFNNLKTFKVKRNKKAINIKDSFEFNKDLLLSSSDDHSEYYKSFLKNLNENNKNVRNYKEEKKINLKLDQINSSPNIFDNKNKKKLKFKKGKTQTNLNKKNNESSILNIEKEDNLKHIKFTNINKLHNINILNNINQNLEDKTRRTNKEKNINKSLLDYSVSDNLNKSQSALSSNINKENITPATVNNVVFSFKKLNQTSCVEQASTVSMKKSNKKLKNEKTKKKDILSEKKKNIHKKNNKDNDTNESKITYKKSNFLNVKKIDINNNNKKNVSSKNIINLTNSYNGKNDDSKNKEKQIDNLCDYNNLNNKIPNENNIIPNKKKKCLFCCIPIC